VSEYPGGEHQQLVERFQAVVSERYGASGSPTAEVALSNVREATEQPSYVVEILNVTDFSGIVGIVYATSSGVQDPIEKELPVGKVVTFQLTPPEQCDSLQEYIMVSVPDGEVFVSPEDYEENGGWTPERVSQEFPGDTDPFSDGWRLG
jgi:hypothetical protein